MGQSFPKMIKDYKPHIQEKIFKNYKTKIVMIKNKVSARKEKLELQLGFDSETVQSRRQMDDIFKVLKEKNCQPRMCKQ